MPNSRCLVAAMILQATHTHLYPGHRGKVSGLTQVSDVHAGGNCLVEFSDGSVTPASISESEDGWQLHTEAYRTAAGTDIAQKCWLVYLGEDGDQVDFRILKNAACSL